MYIIVLYIFNEVTLGYIGHSMGTTSMFMLQSYHPQFARIVKPFIALAPVVYLGHSWSIARLGVPLAPVLQYICILLTLKHKAYEYESN